MMELISPARILAKCSVLKHGCHQLQNEGHVFLPVKIFLGVQAVVAVSAVLFRIVFSEVVQENLPAASVGLGVGYGLHQQLLAYFLLREGLALHEFFQFENVLIAVEGDAFPLLSIPAGTSCLLIVALEALGYIVVYDKTHVRLVDAHAESDCGHYHVHFFHKEQVLVLGPGGGVHAGVIRKGLDAVDGQEPGDFLGLLAAEAVDDARFAGVLLDELDELAADIDLVAYLIVEVGTVEGTFEHLCIHHIEVFLDVSLNLRCGCSREGYDGSDSELGLKSWPHSEIQCASSMA